MHTLFYKQTSPAVCISITSDLHPVTTVQQHANFHYITFTSRHNSQTSKQQAYINKWYSGTILPNHHNMNRYMHLLLCTPNWNSNLCTICRQTYTDITPFAHKYTTWLMDGLLCFHESCCPTLCTVLSETSKNSIRLHTLCPQYPATEQTGDWTRLLPGHMKGHHSCHT